LQPDIDFEEIDRKEFKAPDQDLQCSKCLNLAGGTTSFELKHENNNNTRAATEVSPLSTRSQTFLPSSALRARRIRFGTTFQRISGARVPADANVHLEFLA
jgi:hypothetical protein